MSFIADLHVHSHFSRATSKECTLEGLYYWAQCKGVRVVGTGDFTHPVWFAELKEKLVESAPGLFQLKPEIATKIDSTVPESCRSPVDFMITGEISSIYKSGSQCRRVHSLLLIPDIDTAVALNNRLDSLGNIKSDGRPILGLDPKILVEMALEANDDAYLIPAHIWTPWFSMLGSRSGFDSVKECFGDLAKHVFAAETGLSSDPPMNWRVSDLDNFCLVSNSDLHSPANMGRNANIFNCQVDFYIMKRALREKDPVKFSGTIDMFPEEGKYHLDGHRKCGICMEPEESMKHKNICPVCEEPLVLGVLHRVVELADRPEGGKPSTALPCKHIIPLSEIIAEIYSSGSKTKKVRATYFRLLQKYGPELKILLDINPSELRDEEPRLIDEALRRIRNEEVIKQPGFDGQYGVIHAFDKGEMDKLHNQSMLFNFPSADKLHQDQARNQPPSSRLRGQSRLGEADARTRDYGAPRKSGDKSIGVTEYGSIGVSASAKEKGVSRIQPRSNVGQDFILAHCVGGAGQPGPSHGNDQPNFVQARDLLTGLTDEQRLAAETIDVPVIIGAGPGTGKTRTLTYRIAALISQYNIEPQTILAVTFTNRAANEMRKRLHQLRGAKNVTVATFHALCLQSLRRYWQAAGLNSDFIVVDQAEEASLLQAAAGMTLRKARSCLNTIADKQRNLADASNVSGFKELEHALSDRHMLALDEIIPCFVYLLRANPDIRKQIHYDWVCIDEYQDINRAQYELVKLLCPDGHGLCVIGDPDQAIYSFRGSDVSYFLRFTNDFPDAKAFGLSRNFRSTKMIVSACSQVIRPGRTSMSVHAKSTLGSGVRIRFHEAASAEAEAEFITHEIEKWLGGTTLFSIDSNRVSGHDQAADISMNDIAVLVRVRVLMQPLAHAITRLGLPVQNIGNEPFIGQSGARKLIDALRNLPQRMFFLPAARAVSEFAKDTKRKEQLNQAGKDRLNECLNMAEGFHGTLSDFLDYLLLRQGSDCYNSMAEGITIMTLHAAKGLEFPVVFIACCEYGILPYIKADKEPNLDEERRLLYVGMTRASRALYITSARRRFIFGKVHQQKICPFVHKIEESLRENITTPALKSRQKANQLELNLPDG